MKKVSLIPILLFALVRPSPSSPMDARAYYRELHDSGAAWNDGHRFNRVCFGEEHPRGEPQDNFVATNTFLLVGFWGRSPKNIELQEYTNGVPQPVFTLEWNSARGEWVWSTEHVRQRFALGGAGRYNFTSQAMEKGFPYGDPWIDSHGKCEVIQ
jgi:hypothetical protein